MDRDNVVIRKKSTLLAAARGEHATAGRWAEDAVHIDILDLDMHRLLARPCVLGNRPTQAADAYELCVDLPPNRREFRPAWAEACRAAGQAVRAAAAGRRRGHRGTEMLIKETVE